LTGHSGSIDASRRTAPATERLANALLGLSILSWAVLGLAEAGPGRLAPARLTITALNACVGALFLLRRPVVRHGSLQAVAIALPSLVIAGSALKLAPPPGQWPLAANATFVAGGTLAIAAFLALGLNFAIFPALRQVVGRGPYALVRHPAYLGEMAMVAACSLAAPSPSLWTFWPLAAVVPLVALRIIAEERLLTQSPDYRTYAQKVRWRLLPFLW